MGVHKSMILYKSCSNFDIIANYEFELQYFLLFSHAIAIILKWFLKVAQFKIIRKTFHFRFAFESSHEINSFDSRNCWVCISSSSCVVVMCVIVTAVFFRQSHFLCWCARARKFKIKFSCTGACGSGRRIRFINVFCVMMMMRFAPPARLQCVCADNEKSALSTRVLWCRAASLSGARCSAEQAILHHRLW